MTVLCIPATLWFYSFLSVLYDMIRYESVYLTCSKKLLCLYRVGQKKLHTELMAITLSILNGFSKFFHCWKAK